MNRNMLLFAVPIQRHEVSDIISINVRPVLDQKETTHLEEANRTTELRLHRAKLTLSIIELHETAADNFPLYFPCFVYKITSYADSRLQNVPKVYSETYSDP